MKKTKHDFKYIDKKYRPIPFWSWNEKLDIAETKRQVALMDEAGIGGYFMHARGGLLTEYMGDEWYDNVAAAIEEGTKRGMHSWAYDENGWPSGFGGGRVSGLGEKYQQKSLHVEPLTEQNANAPRTLLVRDGRRYYYNVNEFYVDVLDREVTECFVKDTYCDYEAKVGNKIDGFFTDEPQIWRGTGFPWSLTLEDKFKSKYGYSLIDSLDSLFRKVGDYRKVRIDYWHLVTELFSECFMKVIYDYCTSHGYGFTGHMVCEETFISQLTSNGAVMPHYEYLTIPGMDWLTRPVRECLTPMQLSSAAAQTGKKQILSETFALCGHNVSHAELKRIYEWQMVHGVNLLCTHLEGYSTRGIRKRDYPPAMYYQQPWWKEMRIFFDSMSRIGMLLAEGEIKADTLLLHTQSSAWALYDGIEEGKDCLAEIEKYNRELLNNMRTLEAKHVLYHLGDEILMERHARVEGAELIIGNMRYSRLIIPDHITFLPNTERLIAEFRQGGGIITTSDEIAPNPVSELSPVSYTMRHHEGFDLHYFVNSENKEHTLNITVGNLYLDPVTGELHPFFGKHTFAPYESLVLIDTGEARLPEEPACELSELELSGQWQVRSKSFNSITLDTCDYYFDGQLVERDGYVLNIIPRLAEHNKLTEVRQVYRFCVEDVPDELYIATETPEIFDITLNGKSVEKDDHGYFTDRTVRMLSVSKLVQKGENVLEFVSNIQQSEATYNHLLNSWKFESMKNRLSYDMEIEPVYIVGNFGAKLPDERTELERGAYRINTAPTLVAPPPCVDIRNIESSGYPEFAGELVLSKTFNLTDTDRRVTLYGRGMNVISLSVNGTHVATKLFPPYDVDLSSCLKQGENILEIRILNNLRNVMGPHHLKEGESYSVGPRSFFKETNVFAPDGATDTTVHRTLEQWHDGICLVHFGMGKEN